MGRLTPLLATLSSLRFGAEREAAFLAYKAYKVVGLRRFAIVAAPVLWLFFLYWDVHHHRHFEHFGWIVVCRLIGGAYLAALAVASFRPAFLREQFAQCVLMSGVVVSWIGVLAIMVASPAPNSYLDYYTGLAFILVFLFSILWVHPHPAALLGLALLALFEATQWWIGRGLPAGELRSGATFAQDFAFYAHSARFYLLFFWGLGLLIAYQMELSLRRDFTHENKLRQEQEAVLRLKEEQRRLAEESNSKKSTFLASATHDLRQPLTALDAVVEALDRSLSAGDLDAARQHMALTRRSSTAMRRTLSAVLEISRLESGVVRPDYTEFDLCNLMRDMASQYAALAAGKGLEFRLHLPRRSPHVVIRSDHALLERLVSNLIANAIKYTEPRPGTRSGIVVGVLRLSARARIDVFDTGIGIAEADRAAIFEPFVQLGNKERDREKGLGLGLSIVAQIVALLDQHRLDFSSAPGRGSRFSLDIPHGTTSPPAEQTAPSAAAFVGHVEGVYVLLVEDDLLVGQALQSMLEAWGCLVDRCMNLAQVARFAQEAQRIPDVVLTDFRLPDGTSAHDVIAALEAEFQRPLPTIVLSGELAALAEIRPKVAVVLVKPADSALLRQAIASCANRGGS